jgi:hypothetical protein
LVVVFVLAAAAGVGAYLVVRNETDGGNGNGGGGGGGGVAAASLAAGTASDFDPFGDDGFEDPSFPVDFTDGTLSSPWSTQQYDSFAEKPGVGLRFDLDGTFTVSSVTVSTSEAGWSGEIYVSGDDASEFSTLDQWGRPVVTAADPGATHDFPLDGVEARSVLVWFTGLPPAPAGERQSLEVTEVRFG